MSDTANTHSDEANRPWYRQPWFWFLVLFPAMSITYCIIAITVALNTQSSMVVDDYSKEGLGINQSMARDVMAADLGLEARIRQSQRQLEITLESNGTKTIAPEHLVLQLFHPTLGEEDRVIQLRSVSPGLYRGQVAGDIDGRWYLDLSAPSADWRIKGEGRFPVESGITLRPDVSDRG
ncbi:FixH family protein [Marinobacter sp. OP 3.4]|uniref:FixH family protein n=1 Tax=Marinobacter sp. OP 3.4 TaxID=3076501 RepID=UPI002E1A4626